MDLNQVRVFAKVVQAGSFIGAARELAMPRSTVSRKVAELEQHLGARLLQRTTRKLSLTDVGHAYYQHAARVVAEIDEAEHVVTRMQQAPRGLLRVTTPLNMQYLGAIISSFLERYPEVQVEVVCADRVVDLVQEGFDLAVRAGKLADSTLIARSLGAMHSVVVASPAFIDEHGRPETPEDLAGLDCAVFGGAFAGALQRGTWTLVSDRQTISVAVQTRLVVNDFDILRQAALAGRGAAMLPAFRCCEDLKAGRLERLLDPWRSPAVPMQAVYPSARHLSPKVKAFIDHLTKTMNPLPWERSPAR